MPFELNGRTYLVGALVAFGICLELLKFWPTSTISQTASAVEDRLFSKPYAVSEKSIHKTIVEQQRKRAILLKAPIVNFDMKAAVEKFSKEQSKVLDEQKKKEEAAKDWHWVYNKKLGQWVWKKKSDKTDKKDDKAVAQTPTIPSFDPNAMSADTANNPSAAGFGSGNYVPPTSGFGALGSSASTSKFLSQAEWEALLLKSPNSTETKAFATAYNNHLVTETVFYAIVNEMIKGNADMQAQAVLALTTADPAANSFVLLAQMSGTSQSNSTLTQSLTTAMAVYSQPTNVDDLETVLQQQTTTSVLTAALTQLQNSINTNLNGSGSNPTAQGGTNASVYQPFIAILNTLTSNSAVASQAQNILSQLGASSNSSLASF